MLGLATFNRHKTCGFILCGVLWGLLFFPPHVAHAVCRGKQFSRIKRFNWLITGSFFLIYSPALAAVTTCPTQESAAFKNADAVVIAGIGGTMASNHKPSFYKKHSFDIIAAWKLKNNEIPMEIFLPADRQFNNVNILYLKKNSYGWGLAPCAPVIELVSVPNIDSIFYFSKSPLKPVSALKVSLPYGEEENGEN